MILLLMYAFRPPRKEAPSPPKLPFSWCYLPRQNAQRVYTFVKCSKGMSEGTLGLNINLLDAAGTFGGSSSEVNVHSEQQRYNKCKTCSVRPNILHWPRRIEPQLLAPPLHPSPSLRLIGVLSYFGQNPLHFSPPQFVCLHVLFFPLPFWHSLVRKGAVFSASHSLARGGVCIERE